MNSDFDGAKVAILRRDQVLTLLRDDRDDILWPNCWDLPGGARKAEEYPLDTLARELFEEFGLNLPEGRIVFHHLGPNDAGQFVHFYLLLWDSLEDSAITFGNEGQRWKFMDVLEYLGRADVINHHQRRLRLALATL